MMGQEDQFTKDVSDYLDYNGTMSQYEFAYDQLLKMMGGNYPKNESNSQQWKFLEDNKDKAVNEMKSQLIEVYKKNFSHDEIKKMATYYQSESGRMLIKDRSKMTEKHKEELNTFYNSTVGQKIIGKQEVLTQEISVVSESWSRDLYETSVSLLNNG